MRLGKKPRVVRQLNRRAVFSIGPRPKIYQLRIAALRIYRIGQRRPAGVVRVIDMTLFAMKKLATVGALASATRGQLPV